jgi:hypothetical protein
MKIIEDSQYRPSFDEGVMVCLMINRAGDDHRPILFAVADLHCLDRRLEDAGRFELL